MDFPLSIITPCLERLGAELLLPEQLQGERFAYADTCPAPAAAGEAGPVALLVAPLSALQEPGFSAAGRPVLAVAPAGFRLRGQAGICVAATPMSCEQVCSAVNRHLVLLREWDASMARLVQSGCSNQELLELSEPVIGRYIALSDALYALVAATPSFEPLDELSRSLIETSSYPASAIPLIERVADSQRWHMQSRSRLDQGGSEINPLPSMSRVYRLDGNYAAHLVMVCEQRIQHWEQFLFDVLADRVGSCLERFWQTKLPYREKGSSFLAAILEESVHDPADFKERARLFDLPTEGVFELGVVSGAEERGGVAHIAHQLRTGLKECRAVVLGQRIYVLLISSARGSGKIAEMEGQLFAMVGRLHAELGLSSRFEQLECCHMARLEADVALEYGRKNYPKYLALQAEEPYLDCVFRFNRYFPCYLVDPFSSTAEFMAEYAKSPNLVSRLRRADEENGTNDFGLLKVFLYYDCNIKRTAELMGMHRNTVVYRLNKIKSEYRIDLDDCDTRLFLHYLFGVLD